MDLDADDPVYPVLGQTGVQSRPNGPNIVRAWKWSRTSPGFDATVLNVLGAAFAVWMARFVTRGSELLV